MMIKSAQTSAIIARKRCKPFRCLRCAFSFGSRLELEEHINSHTGSKPFACSVCRKGFNRRSSLWNHNRIHMDFKPFVCPLCNATFKWKNSLKCHRTTHVRHDPAMGKKFDLLSLNLKHLSFGSSCRKFGALPKRDHLGVGGRRSGLFDRAFDGKHPESVNARRERMIKDLLVKVEKQEVQEYNNAWFDKVFGPLHGSKNNDKPADQNEMTEAARAAENLLALKGVDLEEHCNNHKNDDVFQENCNRTINSIPKFGPSDNLNSVVDDKKFIKKLPFPVTKQEMEKVAQAHYGNQMTQPLSSYEKLRLENLRQNQKILAELGLRPVGDASLDADNRSDKENGSKQLDSGTGYAARKSIHNASTALLKKRRRTTTTPANAASPSVDNELRRSTRLVGKTAKYSYEDLVDVDEVLGLRRRSGRPRSGVAGDIQVSSISGSHVRLDESTYTYRKSDKPLEKKYGAIDNVPVGTLFQSRMECCYAGIHGPTVAGIHPGSEVMFIQMQEVLRFLTV